jgi:hypothetical protein
MERFGDTLAGLRLVCADAITSSALRSSVYVVGSATQFRSKCDPWLLQHASTKVPSQLELLVDDALIATNTCSFASEITKWANDAASRCRIHYFKTAKASMPIGASMVDGEQGTAALSAMFWCRCVNASIKAICVTMFVVLMVVVLFDIRNKGFDPAIRSYRNNGNDMPYIDEL